MHGLVLALLENDENSKQVAESLEQSGHDVVFVETFFKAIDYLKNGHFDLIISDVHLENGGNVFDFLRWVRKNPATKKIPFVLFSSQPTQKAKYFEEGVKTTARILGATMFITMELFDSEEFRQKIDSLFPKDNQAIELGLGKKGD